MSDALPAYEVFAIKYATRSAKRSAYFIGGDPHDTNLAMDYYVWLVRNAERTIVVDTGFSRRVAEERGRTFLLEPAEGLKMLDVDAKTVKEVILTHLHYDHVGTFHEFPSATFHLQDAEMSYATGRYMCHERFNHGYEPDEIADMVKLVFKGRVKFHRDTDRECGHIAPGVTTHFIGGHTAGLQCVRVHTKNGWMVLASDSSHYYEHMETDRCFPTVFHVGQMMDGYATLRSLSDDPEQIVPGHDPLVMERYPAPHPRMAGVIVRLDEGRIRR